MSVAAIEAYPLVASYNQISSRPSSPSGAVGRQNGEDSEGHNHNDDPGNGYGSVEDNAIASSLSTTGAQQDVIDDAASCFPLGQARPLSEAEKRAVRLLAGRPEFQYRGEISLNRLTVHAYGSKNPDRVAWIRQALAESERPPEVDGDGAVHVEVAQGTEDETTQDETPQGEEVA